MSDDASCAAASMNNRITLEKDWQVYFWIRVFNCTAQELLDAVQTVGDDAKTVERHLRAIREQQQR
jgi:hypothetical protein